MRKQSMEQKMKRMKEEYNKIKKQCTFCSEGENFGRYSESEKRKEKEKKNPKL